MSDLISREDLIKSIDFDVPINQYERDTLNLVLKRIKALPTVDREESVLKALEEIKAELPNHSFWQDAGGAPLVAIRDVIEIIDRKVNEVKGDKD